MKRTQEGLEKSIGYRFGNRRLLTQALTHSSYANEHRMDKMACNERLEFLGDAVLELLSSEFLFDHFPQMPEGDLTKTRARMVCEPALAYCAREISLGDYLLLGKGEEATGGRMRESVVSDAFEAVIGAIYLDGGLANAKEFVHRFVMNDMENKQLFYDSKTILQEYVQGNCEELLNYRLLEETGPDHEKSFTVEARIGEKSISTGSGHTKKAAEQEAAYHALLLLKPEK